MNVVFMGTPEFSVNSLKIIYEKGYNIEGVFTQPDRPKGRGYKLTFSPVKEQALKYNLKIYQPDKLREQENIEILKELNPDIIIVVAYGQILPKSILDIPKYGCINIHASLLPKYRGAGPIQWSIINGEKTTGITTMYMAEGLDTGDIIFKEEINIYEDETSSDLHDRLSLIGSNLIIKTMERIKDGTATRKKQDNSLSSYAPMLSKDIAQIDFNKNTQTVHNFIRGMYSWPCAYTYLNNKLLKIYKAKINNDFFNNNIPGILLSDKKFIISTLDGGIEFLEIQYEGGKKMSGEDFLRGHNLQKGHLLKK
ncbi:MAG: methionyl-tRNA formyltransferase [Oscillospiraceae bacterium]|nr:methionyl-tRNA formyltransferase [Oscillospiraceae bacterium]